MHLYEVCGATPLGQAFALPDRDARFHTARATSMVPRVGLALCGHPPSLGFHLLIDGAIRQAFRLIFEQIDCSAQAALDHGAPERYRGD
jgi:hypothetical protein